ncbi:MAG: DUF4270 domain-containing protein [Syntrophothermus sp.]
MKSTITKLTLLSIGLFLLFSTSCKKDPYKVGYDLLPGSDTINVKVFDTSTVIAYSLLHDSIRTDKRAANLLGSMFDPEFGKTTSSFFSQFRLSTTSVDFGTGPVMDSVVLQIPYAKAYGDTTTLQRLRVYEVSEDMSSDSSYYSNHYLNYYPNLLADFSYMPNPVDTLRINLTKLTRYFGNKLLSAPADAMNSNLSFVKYMKGLSIVSEPVSAGGGFITFNYKDENTRLILYFHNTSKKGNYKYLINDLCARASFFNHNNYQEASQEVKNQILNHDTAAGKQKLFIQGLGGVQVKLRLPHVEDMKKLGKIAINNARIIMKVASPDTALYSPVPALYLVKKDSAGRIAFLTDYNEGTAYFGGEYNSSTGTYSFRITRHLQQILNGDMKNYDLYILASSPVTTGLVPQRVSLLGTQPSDPAAYKNRLRLEVTYTKIH